MGTYRSNAIPNLRTIKALRGEALRIDLGKEFDGTLTSWMKRKPNDLEYRSFDIQDNRYLYLTKEKASDYVQGSEVTSAIEGKWYFDVEQDIDGEDIKTIFQGTILFQNDITGSGGQEGVAPPDNRYRTIDIVTYIKSEESLSGSAETQSETNIEFVNRFEEIGESLRIESAYSFSEILIGSPGVGRVSLDASNFSAATKLSIHKEDDNGFNNYYFIEALEAGDFLTIKSFPGESKSVAFEVLNTPILSGDYYIIDVSVTSSTGIIFLDEENLKIDGLNKGTPAIIEEDITTIGVGEVGGYRDGDVLMQGTPFTAFAKKLLQKVVNPTYQNPTVGISVSPSVNQEVGKTVNFTITPTFTKRDAGNLTQVVFKRDGVTIRTQANLSPYVDSGQVVEEGSRIYSVEVTYADGDIKNDNFGNPYPTGRILSGTVTNQSSLSGVYYNWYGSMASEPTIGSEIRALDATESNSFTINTGDTLTAHIIAIRDNKTLQSVFDQDSLNANITTKYELSGIVTVPDAGGVDVNYKVYIFKADVPYSENHRHNITII